MPCFGLAGQAAGPPAAFLVAEPAISASPIAKRLNSCRTYRVTPPLDSPGSVRPDLLQFPKPAEDGVAN